MRLQQDVARASEKCVVLSDEDRAEYQRICPEADVTTVPNGADVDYWTPRDNGVEPSPFSTLAISVGRRKPMLPSIFTTKFFPWFAGACRIVNFYIAGQNPPEAVKALASDRVIVTGFVPEMREYVARASVVVMPLRAGAGTKHRVFQALCMKKPVVCTAVAAEGIALTHGETAMLADDPETFAKRDRFLATRCGVAPEVGRTRPSACPRSLRLARDLRTTGGGFSGGGPQTKMTNGKIYRVGFVGAGYVSEFHIKALKRLPHVRIVGITELDRIARKDDGATFRHRCPPVLESDGGGGTRCRPRAHASRQPCGCCA